ncbi:hypothetical protein ACJJTC_014571 [Scirpophaga incertulas]
MHMTCVICSDMLDLSENGCVIKCGHLFHYVCLMQWMQRSSSCPQCRIVVTENSIIRTFPTGLSINTDQDVTLMQCQLDDALLKVKQLEAIAKQRNDNVVAVKEELIKKINEVRIVEDKLRLQTNTCRIYEIRWASYIDQIKELDSLQEELHSNLNALNRALTESEDKKKSMRSQIVQLVQEVKKLKEDSDFELTLHKILHDQQVAKTTAETSGPSSNMKRRAPEDSPNESHKTMRMQQPEIHNVEDIENSFPTELAILNGLRNVAAPAPGSQPARSAVPKLTAKRKLKKPAAPLGNQAMTKYLQRK